MWVLIISQKKEISSILIVSFDSYTHIELDPSIIHYYFTLLFTTECYFQSRKLLLGTACLVYTIKSHPSFKHTSSSENYINWHIFLNCCGTGVIVRIGKIASKGNIYRSNKLYIFINESYVRVMYIYDFYIIY